MGKNDYVEAENFTQNAKSSFLTFQYLALNIYTRTQTFHRINKIPINFFS
jgi:hypothetical protein